MSAGTVVEAGKVHVEVSYDRGSQSELARQVPELAEQLTVQITDQESLNAASEYIRAAEQWIKAVDRIMDPVRDATHKAWKAAIAAQDQFKAPVERPLKALRTACAQFLAAMKAEADRKQREADEAQRKANEAEARRVASELRAVGATSEEIQDVKQTILATTAPAVIPQVAPPSGASVRTLYSAEITDLKAFLTHLVNDQYLLTLFGYSATFKKAIESELRGEAQKRKEAYRIPGTQLVKTASGTWR